MRKIHIMFLVSSLNQSFIMNKDAYLWSSFDMPITLHAWLLASCNESKHKERVTLYLVHSHYLYLGICITVMKRVIFITEKHVQIVNVSSS